MKKHPPMSVTIYLLNEEVFNAYENDDQGPGVLSSHMSLRSAIRALIAEMEQWVPPSSHNLKDTLAQSDNWRSCDGSFGGLEIETSGDGLLSVTIDGDAFGFEGSIELWITAPPTR